jgi:sigma-B regulation protein RsbU (phosphoserine phosphatase)
MLAFLFCQNVCFGVENNALRFASPKFMKKKPSLLYIPLLMLFLFVGTVLTLHYVAAGFRSQIVSKLNLLPFTYASGAVLALTPEAESAGVRVRDRIVEINGKTFENETDFYREITSLQPEQTARFLFSRQTENGATEQREVAVTLKKAADKNSRYYSQSLITVLYTYFLPTICILLGFWVVAVRPRDFVAWLLLLLLLGISSTAFEGYPDRTIFGFYRIIFFNTWALAMFLFGIYFPERLSLDRRFPWAKWILIAPLLFQLILMLFDLAQIFLNVNPPEAIKSLDYAYDKIGGIINILAISLFFAAVGVKSGTLENPDSRRRLRVMLAGTTAAMLPPFSVVLYSLATGSKGSFFDIVPFWWALAAILAIPLFPITMAYVIVVQRAMDVSVVVRQGLQYALAKNTVAVLQILLPIVALVAIVPFIGQLSLLWQIPIFIALIGLTFLFTKSSERFKLWIDRRFFREAYNAEQILSDLSEDVRMMVETKPLLETVSHRISESLHVPQVALLLKNGDGFHPAYALGYDGVPSVSFSENDALIERLKRNEPLTIYADDPENWVNRQAADDERQILKTLNSQLLLPVGVKEKLSGFISLSPKRSDAPYTSNDLRLLRSVAAQTGLALENSHLTETIAAEAVQRERLNREVEIAKEVQERLFPQDLPHIEGLDYSGACRPALGVGGDYYDFLELSDDKFGIAIGDVSGKGIAASLLMASLQASLRGQAIHYGDDLASLMSQVNKLVYDASTSNRYATFFYGQYDRKTGKFAYVNAGHNPPFLFRKDGELVRLEEGGAVVGMLPPAFIFYKQGEIEMRPGDLLVGFTDGISEAMNPAEDEWGEEKMIEAIRERINLSSEEMLRYLIEEADRFAAGAKQHDDMTLIVVKIID